MTEYWRGYVLGFMAGALSVGVLVVVHSTEIASVVHPAGSGLERKLTPEEMARVKQIKEYDGPDATTERGKAVQKCIRETDFKTVYDLYFRCK